MDVAHLKRRRLLRILGSVACMMFGCALVFSLVLLMNAQNQPPPKEESKGQQMAAAEKKKKKKPKRKPRQKPKRRERVKSAKRAPLPNLSTALSGMSFGLPQLQGMNLDDLASRAVGEAAANDVVMTADAVDVEPRPVAQSPPAYPQRAIAKNIEGYVVLRLLINRSGGVDQVKVMDSSPAGVFEECAVAAARGWRFEPARYQGEAVKMWARIRVPFKLT
jgi:protein TonB